MSRRRLAAGVACALAMTGVPALPVSATASTGSPVVLDVPANRRFEPRATEIIGDTGSQGLVVRQESDPVTGETGQMTGVLIGPDGTRSPADLQANDVFGDRVVNRPGASSITSTVLPEGSPTTVQVPDGYTLLDYTGDGLVLRSGSSGSATLSLLPWAGGDPLPVTGLPAGYNPSTNSGYVHDATGTVLRIVPAAGGAATQLFVDTSVRRAWSLGAPGTTCDPGMGTSWAVNDGVIAWQSGGAAGRFICTQTRPSAQSDTVAAAVARPAVTMPVPNQWYDVSLLPVGSAVVVWSTWGSRAREEHPVYAVHPDGSLTQLLGWGHDITAGGAGKVVAVGGASASDAAVRRIDVPSGDTQTVATIAPVRATTTSLAVDDGRVLAMDNSALGDAVVQRSLSFAGDGQVGPAEWIDDHVTDRVVAGAGQTSWEKNGAWAVRGADGTTTSSYLPHNGSVPRDVQAVSGRWVLYGTGGVLDTTQNSFAPSDSQYDTASRDLVDGVLYLQGGAVSSALQDRVVMRDLTTGQAASLHVPGCLSSGTVQAAGSWLMVRCQLSQGGGEVVMDRTGATASYPLSSGVPLLLGNGFAARPNADGSLDWRPLADPGVGWQQLAGPGSASMVAVGKGTQPVIAWSDGRTTRVAVLPVDTTANPPHPGGVSKPSAPTVTVTPYDRAMTLRWAPAAVSEQLTGYIVTGAGGFARYLGPGQTSTTYTGLTNGSEYKMTVTAVNIAGRSATTQPATPLAPPAAPTNVQATVDPVTSKVHVTWDWAATSKSEALVSFDAGAGGPILEGLAPDARSASFVMPTSWTGPVTVTSRGPVQSADGDSAPLVFPGMDARAPTSSVGGVPDVSLSRTLAVRVRGADDRELDGLDVRWRSAGFGQRLGGWSRPQAWQGRQPGLLHVDGLRAGGTYCFSSRARDSSGNVSQWSPPRCTSVALDDRSLARSGNWSNVVGSGFYQSTASRTKSYGAALTRRSVRGSSVWLVASTCPTCGSVTVFGGHARLGRVSLRSSARQDQRLIKLPRPMETAGNLKIVTGPTQGRVTIDAVAVRDY